MSRLAKLSRRAQNYTTRSIRVSSLYPQPFADEHTAPAGQARSRHLARCGYTLINLEPQVRCPHR